MVVYSAMKKDHRKQNVIIIALAATLVIAA
jgi:hypothetical protein